MAAAFDLFVAMAAGVLTAKVLPARQPLLQTAGLAAAFFAYYLLFEALTSRTPGKLLTGLVVVQFNGAPCTWRQSLIRTVYRVLEVNPALFGAIPAALSIVLSKHHQRLGDQAAGTIVVPTRRLRRLQ